MKKVICMVLVIVSMMTGISALAEKPWTTVDFPGYDIYADFMYEVYEEYWGHWCYEEVVVLKNRYSGLIDTCFIICNDQEGKLMDAVLSQDEVILSLVDYDSVSGTILNFNEKVNEQYDEWTVYVR